MKKLLALTASLAAIATSTAVLAADLPSKRVAPVAPVAAPYSWTGFYVGLNAGGAWGNSNIRTNLGGMWIGDVDEQNILSAANRNLSPASFMGGAQIGYNYQINQFVLGIEADANFFGQSKSYSTGVMTGANPFGLPAPSVGTYWATGKVSANNLFTIRPRVGFAIDRVMIYATGGLAISSVSFNQNIGYLNESLVTLPITSAAGGANAGSKSATQVGWTIGAGAEWAVTNNISLKAEYLYVDLGSLSFASSYTSPVDQSVWTATHKASLRSNIARVGVNYKF